MALIVAKLFCGLLLQELRRGLLYRSWVEDNRAYVTRISNGRLGYVHMPDMSFGALSQLYVDLDAENQKI